ncbi:MAG TPA: hypothetical protein VF452_11090 [Candidatus Binatia bacterium]
MHRVVGCRVLSFGNVYDIISKVSLYAIFAGLMLGCAGLPATGTIGGQTIETRVDSEVARYFLTNYVAGRHTDPLLDKRIDRIYQKSKGSLPNQQDLKKLSDEFSVDFAALYLADRIARVPANQRFSAIFRENYEYAREAFPQGQMKMAGAADYDVLIVPTYLYKRRFMLTGADLAVPRAALQKVGFTCYFVETIDDAPIETNAEIIMAAIQSRAGSDRRLIVISASKSGPEVALALTKLGPSGTRHVAAWINAVGALQGTPMVDDKLMPDFELLTGKVNPAGGESMATIPSRRRFALFKIPRTVLVVNYFGIPTTGSVSFFGRKGYFPLRKYGPNDGSLLLADMIFPGGVTLPRLGSDHMQMGEHLDIATVALAMTVIEWLKTHDSISPIPDANIDQDNEERAKDSDYDTSIQRAGSSP